MISDQNLLQFALILKLSTINAHRFCSKTDGMYFSFERNLEIASRFHWTRRKEMVYSAPVIQQQKIAAERSFITVINHGMISLYNLTRTRISRNRKERHGQNERDRSDEYQSGASWQLYIDAPMPMVTIFKTLDITNLMGLKAAGSVLLHCLHCRRAVGVQDAAGWKKMMAYDQIGMNVIVANQTGGTNSCDIPYSKKLDDFNRSIWN